MLSDFPVFSVLEQGRWTKKASTLGNAVMQFSHGVSRDLDAGDDDDDDDNVDVKAEVLTWVDDVTVFDVTVDERSFLIGSEPNLPPNQARRQ